MQINRWAREDGFSGELSNSEPNGASLEQRALVCVVGALFGVDWLGFQGSTNREGRTFSRQAQVLPSTC